ncbi:MAG: hypothetical protein GC185_04445 [Alphaproteobacteria bacterium]|nr:hypothetical protein [Alphaproteobacteria bacterium]
MTSPQQETLNKLLVEAVKARDLQHVELYVAKGADVNMTVGNVSERIKYPKYESTMGRAPLYHCMLDEGFDEKISDFLFAQGVAVDVKSHTGSTPLMLAVRNGNLPRVKYYLSRGADPLAVNNAGEMVFDMARRLSAGDVPDRQKIIDALIAPMPDANKTAPQGKAEAVGNDNAGAPVETTQGVVVSKPLQISPRKGPPGGGFKL